MGRNSESPISKNPNWMKRRVRAVRGNPEFSPHLLSSPSRSNCLFQRKRPGTNIGSVKYERMTERTGKVELSADRTRGQSRGDEGLTGP